MNSRTYVVMIIAALLLPSTGYAKQTFEQKHYLVIKDLIWAADKVEVPRALLLAICWGEGSFRTDKELTHMDGHTLSYGTCQVKLELAQDMDRIYKHKTKVTPQSLTTTRINAFYAAKALKFHLARYNGNWQLAADAYNKYTAISEKTEYVKKVNKHLDMVHAKITALKD